MLGIKPETAATAVWHCLQTRAAPITYSSDRRLTSLHANKNGSWCLPQIDHNNLSKLQFSVMQFVSTHSMSVCLSAQDIYHNPSHHDVTAQQGQLGAGGIEYLTSPRSLGSALETAGPSSATVSARGMPVPIPIRSTQSRSWSCRVSTARPRRGWVSQAMEQQDNIPTDQCAKGPMYHQTFMRLSNLDML